MRLKRVDYEITYYSYCVLSHIIGHVKRLIVNGADSANSEPHCEPIRGF